MTKKEFARKWLENFAPEMTKSQYEKRHVNEYIWHVFSWKIVPDGKYLCGSEARKAYDETVKRGAMYINFFDDFSELLPITKDMYKAEQLENNPETYVVGRDFSWTYIVTHETVCGLGPYFMKIKGR